MSTQSEGGGSTNASNGLNKMLGQLNLPTLAMIVLMGGGNWLETKAGNDFNAAEIRQATREIHELYPMLQDAIRRQQRMQESLDHLAKQ